jgi:hypothetical protein
VLLVATLLASIPAARADDPARPPAPDAPPAQNVPDDAAKEALDRFQKRFASPDMDERLDAVKALRPVLHPTVALALFDVGVKNPDLPVRIAAFKALQAQTPSAKTLGPRLAKFLGEAAEESRKAKAKGDYGVLVDPKTGQTDETSPEGKAALRAKHDRGKMLAEALHALDATGWRGAEGVDCLREFLGDGNDDLVVLSLGLLARWKEWGVFPDVLELFLLYPREDKVDVGSVSVDTGAAGGADQAAAKRKWMAKYGDPDRRRPRPKVVKAIKQFLLDVTGEKIETPDALREYMKRPDVKRKVRAGR